MARTINEIRIALHPENNPALAVISGRVLYLGLSPDTYVKFAEFVEGDLDRRFPWHRHPLYKWARRKCGEEVKE